MIRSDVESEIDNKKTTEKIRTLHKRDEES